MKTLTLRVAVAVLGLWAWGALAQAIPGTRVSAKITTGNEANTFPIGDTVEMKGTPKQVANTAARDAIPAERRTEGMECWVIDISTAYRLVGGILNANWAVVVGGVGSATNAVTTISSNNVAISTAATNLHFWAGSNVTLSYTNSPAGNVHVTIASGGSGLWEYDIDGNPMPSAGTGTDANWELDLDGNLEPL